MITSEANDSVFAIVDSKADAKIADKVGKLIEIALRESLGIDSMQQVADFARKKQVQITDERGAVPLNEKLQAFRRTQLRLDVVQQLKDMAATVTFLGLNQAASGSVIYDGMTLKELAESTYTELLAFA